MRCKLSPMIVAAVVMVLAANGAMADTFGTFNIEFVPISGATNPTSGYGIVNNDYRMGTYEVTNDQWDKFEAAYGPVRGRQSAYTGTNVPVDSVTWFEAAQFTNWLNTSTNHQAAYKFTGTQGNANYTFEAWAPSDYGYNANNPFRNSSAFYFLPTEDEWVKAAYWNGTALQEYATKPGQTLFQGNGTNGGWNYNYNWDNGPAGPIDGPWNVGSGSQELNGTHDMMGNDWEWMESPWISGDYGTNSARAWRGTDWNNGDYSLVASYRDNYGYPSGETHYIGFRVASIPEPSTLILLAAGAIGFLGWAWRRRKQINQNV